MRFRKARPVIDNLSSTLSNGNHLTTSDLRRILSEGHQRHIQSNLERVSTALGASGPNRLSVHFTPSLLSSASLLASYVKHRILRNLEHMGAPTIRRTLDYCSEKNPSWSHSTSQEARQFQCAQVEEYLMRREGSLKNRLVFDEGNEVVQSELDKVQDDLRRVRIAQQYLEDKISGNLHPSMLLQGDRVFLTPTEAAQLPSPSATMRGVLIRIKGPKRGNRAMTWQKSAGRISINSVKYVVYDEAKLGIPSKMGIFGLTVRFVYARRNRLVDQNTPLNVLDSPGYSFMPRS